MLWTQSNNQSEQKSQMTAQEAAVLGGVVIAIALYQKLPAIQHWYFVHYEEIHLIGVGVVLAALAAIIYQIKKRTKKFTDRALLLRQVWDRGDGILAGTTDDGVEIHVPEETRTGHTQILGATGKGKTKSIIEAWMSRDILSGQDVLLIDGKGDPDIVDKIRQVTDRLGDRCLFNVFDLGNPTQSCAVNPLEHGTAQQITDRLFTAFTFEDSYYRAVQYDVTGNVITLIQEVDYYEYAYGNERKRFPGVVTFKRLYELLSSDEALANAINQSQNEALKTKLTHHLKQARDIRTKNLSGLLSQLGPYAEGEVAELVNGGDESIPRQCRNVSDLLVGEHHRQIVLLILIPTLKYQQIGHQLGKLLLQELGWAVGERASKKGACQSFVPVFLDEFSAFVYSGFSDILNKARSSNVALHLSHQSLGDLGRVSADFATIVNTNTNIKCLLGLNDPETADWMARHLGTESEEKITERVEQKGLLAGKRKTGDLSVREVEAYKIHPNSLKNFMNGRGVIHMPTPRGNLTEEIQFLPFSWTEIKERGN